MVNIKIEGVSYQVEEGLTILEAAKKCGYEIPSLCAFNHGECNHGSCRVCLVEVVGARGLVASCIYPVNEGMEIIISSPKATEARRASVELLLSNHNINCQQCDKNGKCELLHVAGITGAREGRYQGSKTATTLDELSPAIIRDTSKCILCGRCVARCKNAHGEDMGILGFENRGFNTIVAPSENRSFLNSPCIQCGQCVSVCPTGALMEKSEIGKVDAAFKAGKHVVVQTAPAVRADLGRANRDNVVDSYINGNEEDVCADGIWQNYFTEQPERLTVGDKKAWPASRRNVALGSDAFFPFSDNIKRAFASGVKYIAEPGGSIRDDLVIEECNKKGMVMAFTGMRLFHH